jgi:transposase-like protein
LSLCNLEEMMQERGVSVDHSTIHRWVIKLTPVLEEAFRKQKRKRGIAVGDSWRLDETYIGNTVDFLLTAKRDRRAARRFLASPTSTRAVPTKRTSRTSIERTARMY